MRKNIWTLVLCFSCIIQVMGHKKITLEFYGTPIEVSSYSIKGNVLVSFEDKQILEDMNKMKTIEYVRLLHDCSMLKEKLRLNDWGYLKLVDKVAHACLPNENKAVMLAALLMSGNGYDVRIGRSGTKLYLFFASNNVIYECNYITENNVTYYVYPIAHNIERNIKLSNSSDVGLGSRPVSLIIEEVPLLSYRPSPQRELSIKKYPEWIFSVNCNENLIDFYNDVPASYFDNNIVTRWTQLANTPLSEEVQRQLYPRMYQLTKGLNQREAVNRILLWIQMAFKFKYDDDVWGENRAFYPEETLYYPYCDTEDRSALMSRIITDILGLKTVFLYYPPGHTAIGVAFTDENVDGDCVEYEGEKYTVCDGVNFGASVGHLVKLKNPSSPKMLSVATAHHLLPNQLSAPPTNSNNLPHPNMAIISDNQQEKNKDMNDESQPAEVENSATFAVIIGNEDYHLVAKVPFASNDAHSFAECCHKTLGLPQKNIKIYENATYGTIIGAINSLKRIAKAYNGELNIIFYYAGHGIPNEETGESYLLPIDGDGLSTEVCYSLNRLYQELDGLNARHVTVFLDACFSGSQRGNGMIAAARGVAIKAKHNVPRGNTIVFCAASGKQTAYPYIEKEHGMFTYYILKKLTDSNGYCTMGDLGDYVGTMVNRQAVVTNNKEQTPLILIPENHPENWKQNKLK